MEGRKRGERQRKEGYRRKRTGEIKRKCGPVERKKVEEGEENKKTRSLANFLLRWSQVLCWFGDIRHVIVLSANQSLLDIYTN